MIRKEIIGNPHLPCVIQHTEITGDEATLARLRVYALCAPHLCTGGWGNNGYVMEAAGRQVLAAEKHGRWLAVAADVPFSRLSCGYVGRSDGWTDLADNLKMDWEFDRAPTAMWRLLEKSTCRVASDLHLRSHSVRRFRALSRSIPIARVHPLNGTSKGSSGNGIVHANMLCHWISFPVTMGISTAAASIFSLHMKTRPITAH